MSGQCDLFGGHTFDLDHENLNYQVGIILFYFSKLMIIINRRLFFHGNTSFPAFSSFCQWWAFHFIPVGDLAIQTIVTFLADDFAG